MRVKGSDGASDLVAENVPFSTQPVCGSGSDTQKESEVGGKHGGWNRGEQGRGVGRDCVLKAGSDRHGRLPSFILPTFVILAPSAQSTSTSMNAVVTSKRTAIYVAAKTTEFA